jgi:phosphatidylglycerophosphate synthase
MVPADEGGKFKTSVQNTAIITILMGLIITSGWERFGGYSIESLYALGGWRGDLARIVDWIPYWMVFASTVISVVTGVNYLWRHRHLLREDA